MLLMAQSLSLAFPSAGGESASTSIGSAWDVSYNWRPGFGYKDNVLSSPRDAAGRAYTLLGGDASVLRLSEGHLQLYGFSSIDHLRYWDPSPARSETLAMLGGEVTRTGSGPWSFGARWESVYQDQFVDLSATEDTLSVLRATGLSVAVRPGLEGNWNSGWRVSLELPLGRQWFDAPLDDYWEWGVSGRIRRDFESGLRLEGLMAYEHRDYDTRSGRTSRGATLVDDPLQFDRVVWEARVRFYLDEARRWRLSNRFGYRRNRDTTGGFFDYDRWRWRGELRYQKERFQFTSIVSYSHYDYFEQRGDMASELRSKGWWRGQLQCRLSVSEKASVVLAYEHEFSDSNLRVDSYRGNHVSLSYDREF